MAQASDEQIFTRLFEAGEVGVLTCAADGKVTLVNRAAARLIGAPDTAIVGKALADLLHPDQRNLAERILSAPDPESGLLRLEVCFPREDGEDVWGDASCARISDAPDVVALSIADVTARRRTEEALRQSELGFRTLLDAASDLVLVLDLDGNIVDANRYACRALGYLKVELLSMHATDIEVHSELQRRPEIQPGVPLTVSGIHRRADGTQFPVEVRLSQFERRGRTLVMALARDVSDRQRLEEARAQFVGQVVSAQEDERRRIALELHDALGQLLTALSVKIRSVEELPEAGPLKLRLADIRALSERVTGEVETLAHQLRPPALDDLGFVAAVEGHVEAFIRTHGIQTELHVRGLVRPQRLPAEVEVALYRIVQEALTNIARHSGASSVGILLDRRPDTVRLVVEDDGLGFDVDGPGAAQRLGLAGIRERAALLGGSASVESGAGGGTAVYVTLPMRSLE